MTPETIQILESDRDKYPMLYGRAAPAHLVDDAVAAIGLDFPADYREFLRRFGSAIVGAYPIFGVTPAEELGNRWSVVDVNRAYREDGWSDVGEWLIVSADHAGNPIGIAPDGSVWLNDHDFGDVVPLAVSFEDFIRSRCLRVAG
ncbi:MAG TPA: SMI1/KNR4 family protein [Thermoanaerobaculia bacterium]|nr:SMI1/KNR4 family protein [Thermoanaerobaculia bacterium]